MSNRGDRAFLFDIKEAIDRIEEYIKGIVYEQLLENKEKQDAVVRNLEVIGEAVKRLSKALREKYRDVKWKEIAGLRDKMIPLPIVKTKIGLVFGG